MLTTWQKKLKVIIRVIKVRLFLSLKFISASLAFSNLSSSASDSIRAASTLSLAASTAASASILADSARDCASAKMGLDICYRWCARLY